MAQPVGTKRKPYRHNLAPRTCRFPGCNNVFDPMNSNQHYCKAEHYQKCKICGKEFKVNNLVSPPVTCSKKCAYTLRVQNRPDGYGEAWKRKCKETTRKHFGVDYPMQSDAVKRVREQSCMNTWGVSHPMKNKKVVKKLSETTLKNHGVMYPCMLPQCRNSVNAISSINLKIANELKLSGLEYELEFPLGRYKFDIRIANTNVLLEINPYITHNVKFSPWGSPIPKNYHRLKSKYAFEHGFVCFCIWDWTNFIETLHGMLYSKYFEIEDLGSEVFHAYDAGSRQCVNLDTDSDSIYPIYDDGYSIQFIY